MAVLEWFRNQLWIIRVYVAALVGIPLAATLYALAAFSWYRGSVRDLLLFAVLYTLTCIGITVGYHRLITHRSFECHPAVRAVLLALGCLAVEGSPIRWASTHIKHHAYADHDGDPHSPLRGMFFAHVGWMARPESFPDPRMYTPYLFQDPLTLWFTRTYFLWVAVSLLVPFLLGGWSGLLWGGLVRIFFTHHVTWSVNSVCHLFGSRPFRTTDTSANNWIVGLLAFGEGWHNNHHAFPQSAIHGLHWRQVDLSGALIRLLRLVRLAWNIHVPSPALITARTRETSRLSTPQKLDAART